MTVPVVAFFNNKGGVGKTSLVYHLAWMYADLGHRLLAADLDPQANLTAAFLDEDRLEALWPDCDHRQTVYGAIEPLLVGEGDIVPNPPVELIEPNLGLLVGDLALSAFEDELSQQWPQCLDARARAFRVISAFWRTLQNAARQIGAAILLVDLGPNLGAMNRAALIAADYLVVPVAPDLFSLQGLRNLGPAVRRWQSEWQDRLSRNPLADLPLPSGSMAPIGYVVMQHAVRLDRPVRAYERWAARIPAIYAEEVLGQAHDAPERDPHLLGLVKHYRSLMAMAQEARKPMFHLTSADGAVGAHATAVRQARENFGELADAIARRCGLEDPARGAWAVARTPSAADD